MLSGWQDSLENDLARGAMEGLTRVLGLGRPAIYDYLGPELGGRWGTEGVCSCEGSGRRRVLE